MKPPTKFFTTISYVLLTTLWIVLWSCVIAHVVLIPSLLLAAILWDVIGDMLFWVIFWIALAFCVFLFYYSLKFLKYFLADHWTCHVPKLFSLWILPFWLPFFWGLAASAIGFYLAPMSWGYHGIGAFFGFPQYFFLYSAAAFSGEMDFFMMVANIANFFIAVAGTVYSARIAPPVAKLKGLILYSIITLFLCGLVGFAYKHFRMEVFLSSCGICADELKSDQPPRAYQDLVWTACFWHPV